MPDKMPRDEEMDLRSNICSFHEQILLQLSESRNDRLSKQGLSEHSRGDVARKTDRVGPH